MNDSIPSKRREEKVGKLGAKPEWNGAGGNARISSRDWIGDFEGESMDLDLDPSLFDAACRDASLNPLLKTARISSSDWIGDFEGKSVDLGPMDPSLFDDAAHWDAMAEQLTAPPPPTSILSASHLPYPSLKRPTDAPSAASAAETNAPPSASAATKKTKKKRRKPMFDETVVVEPNDGDVLSGRGGLIYSHPGNVRFRKEAMLLRPWYRESSKKRKQEISGILVDFVRNQGNRFLGKGEDGLWHEMIGNGPHRKASRALRERIRGGNARSSRECLPHAHFLVLLSAHRRAIASIMERALEPGVAGVILSFLPEFGGGAMAVGALARGMQNE